MSSLRILREIIDMSRRTDPRNTPAYNKCLELYLKNGGKKITEIERDMKAAGYLFDRRILYSRFENRLYKPGWIEKYAWKQLLSEPGAVATGAFSVSPSVSSVLSVVKGLCQNPTTENTESTEIRNTEKRSVSSVHIQPSTLTGQEGGLAPAHACPCGRSTTASEPGAVATGAFNNSFS